LIVTFLILFLTDQNYRFDSQRINLRSNSSTDPRLSMESNLRPQDVEFWEECVEVLPRVTVSDDIRNSRRAPVDSLAKSEWTSISGKDFPRVPALSDFDMWLKNVIDPLTPLVSMNYLTTSPGDPEEALHPSPPNNTDACVFKGHSLCDLHILGSNREDNGIDQKHEQGCGSPFSKKDLHRNNGSGHPCMPHSPYDLINFQHTLEHLYDPLLALLRLRRVLAPGGWVHTTVPHYNIPHMVPNHFLGVSPCGLYALFKMAGLDTKRIGWWGSKRYASGLTLHHTWYDWRDIGGMTSERDNLPVGDTHLAIQAWTLARRDSLSSFSEPFNLNSRPILDPHLFLDILQKLESQMSVAFGTTLLSIMRKNTQWVYDDADRIVIATAIADFFEPLISHSFDTCETNKSQRYLVFGPIAYLVKKALKTSLFLTPWNKDNERLTCFSGAFISDLWTSRVDPFQTLFQMTLSLAPGAPLFITCKVAGDVRITTPSLGLCTRQGLVATLLRANFTIEKMGVWGTNEYAFKALQGLSPSVQVHFSAGAPFVVSAALDQPHLLNELTEDEKVTASNHFQNILNQRSFIESTIWVIAKNRI